MWQPLSFLGMTFRLIQRFCLSTLFLAWSEGHAQVLNIESKRFYNDTSGWAGNTKLNFLYQYNSNHILTAGNTIHVQYQKNLVRWIFLNDVSLNRFNGQNLLNTGYQHVRLNHRIKHGLRVTWEAYAQTQYNKPMQLHFRALSGTGPRIRVIRNDKLRMYVATSYFFEYELSSAQREEMYTHRNSTYLTFTWFIKEHSELSSTTYYQPAFNDLRDFRIATDFNLTFEITKHFAFGIAGSLLYDTRQPVDVPNLIHRMEQRLVYTF